MPGWNNNVPSVEQGGIVVNHDGQQAADVLIQGEHIAAVGTDLKVSGVALHQQGLKVVYLAMQ
jgi:dihydroorotase-like cyclic amidohydrolase